MMHKWSTRSPDHNTTRVRNNQRRHRARVKSHTQDLEARLADTQSRLDEALEKIGQMSEEMAHLRRELHGSQAATIASDECPSHHRQDEPEDAVNETGSFSDQSELVANRDPRLRLQPRPQHEGTTPRPEQNSPSKSNGIPLDRSQIVDVNFDQVCGSENFPASRSGESTTSCTAAFETIKQQCAQTDCLELQTVWETLKPAFRCAPTPGEGCRVETHFLFRLLDMITSPSDW
ncbi:Uu.00g140620.m01.CDS01 [Anthostomella pinea]|uniref:Uu.00g140620.m01.CDS01 n=1 Tax=Anthostomella pinea TaxID=933095 RepID=A0AAI8VQ83_9PEZI|nr:Uu.00g140620.m01.CDS01 [Anthostomella pinea]